MNRFVKVTSSKWIYLYSGLTPENKGHLQRYFKTIYPREYVQKLVAALEEQNVQFKET